jgi:3-oxoacid CoA-transferase subunit A
MDKRVDSAMAAIEDIHDGATLMLGGFGLCGIPENLILALKEKGVRDLTCISNNAGVDEWGIGLLLQKGQVRKMISTYVGENAIFERLALNGDIEVELTPQGTLAERIRSAGAGIPAFYTPTGVGTEIAEGKETRIFDGTEYLLEQALPADFALIKAWRGDPWGNLIFRKTARNFNAIMATAGQTTIVEVEDLVELGGLAADQVHTPGVFVQRILQGQSYEKRIEQRTTRDA